ncbi:MAG: hypothetical protein E6J62_03355 [Deltaproteobacteria bacterium]|nr:MAG: hypothetical protein E6J85_18565 [Deltaproteobacteria bacterium]TMB30753.1 MAG: hypothetical protein E6J61_11970 [Deltaproteobacteria bacterium]TMB38531.1 MAG: hypothetical protein E6J62_03355 [Deltaproteobacteria bacterium]
MKGPLVALPLALLASCALPVVSAGTFLPAGDLRRGDVHASVSMEVGRVLAGPTDVGDLGQRNPVPPETQQWEVLTWIASDLSIRWQALDRLALEAQLKLTDPVVPGYPVPVGGALGFRLRLLDLGPTREGLAIELGGRFVGVGVTEDLNRQTPDGRTQVDRWTYRALGAEVPLIITYRVAQPLAFTWSPFLRAYWIRAWHETFAQDGSEQLTRLQWTPVLSAGMGLAAALDFGPVQVSPGCALELATRAGPNAPTKLIVEPGLSVGLRF